METQPQWGLPKPPEYLEPEQVRQLISASVSEKYRLIYESLWQSGGRVNEVLLLQPEHIGNNSLIMHNLKQRDKQAYKEVTITPELCQALKQYAKDNRIPEHTPIFRGETVRTNKKKLNANTLWKKFTRLTKELGIYKVKKSKGPKGGKGVPVFRPAWCHLLRHSCGQYILDSSGSTELVQAHLGHSSIITSQRYAQLRSTKARKQISEIDWKVSKHGN